MLLGLAALPQEPLSSADNAGAGEATAEGEEARDKQILQTLEELFTKGMAGVSPEPAADGKADARGSKDAFRKVRDEAAERLRKSDTELQVVDVDCLIWCDALNSPSRRGGFQQTMNWLNCLAQGMRPNYKGSLRA